MASKKQQEEWEETCTFFGTFIETRYDDPKKIPKGDEKIAYDLYCVCGMIDSDGISCLLQQPAPQQAAMLRSVRKLGLAKLADNAKKAATALRKSGLSLKRARDNSAISALLRPFEQDYYDQLRKDAYKCLYDFFSSSEAFVPYVLNCQRMDREGGNPFDPKEWRPPKFKGIDENIHRV